MAVSRLVWIKIAVVVAATMKFCVGHFAETCVVFFLAEAAWSIDFFEFPKNDMTIFWFLPCELNESYLASPHFVTRLSQQSIVNKAVSMEDV